MAFFHLPPSRKFKYQPRYYDEDKEFREEIIYKAKKDLGLLDEKEYKPSIRGKFKNKGEKEIAFNFRRREEKKSNSRILLLLIILASILYFIFY